jgi:hypothetical protein
MSETKFTPGPWTWDFDRDDEQNAIVWLESDDNMRVCFLAHCAKVSETHANAALIAAAPDLYEALAAIVDHETNKRDFFTWGKKVDAATAALKKARGET